ncbi:hypothetical protein PV371_38425 [Streptomyces sp. TX20-6-3]|uniref:hypothetical protein n=1 Tax=Streptomyces sp. TX20-6-3 TaxID=3028705 RepID=UPI0029A5787C|nr:hypothetical protein [Streptomyces sp. TX20-6-3]MDX2565413.1 hypothetical protein [Streptomyces sp. TX20-6-3]
MARTAHVPLSVAHDGNHDTEAPTDSPAQQDAEGNDDTIDDLPDDHVSPVPATRFGLYNAHEEAATW